MRKQTKIAALVSAAALLTIGAAMTSFAAWSVEDGQWVYLDSDGAKVEYEWKKSGANWYYLGEGGYMATNQLIDDSDDGDIYYVGEDGRRVTNDWRSIPNDEGEEVNGEVVDTLWYYFGATGKAYRRTETNSDDDFVKKTVPWSGGSNVFFFDENGHMVSGWISDYLEANLKDTNIYYLGDETEGWARAKGYNGSTGWYYLEVPEFMGDGYEDEEWFCFQTNGKAYKADAGKETVSKYIDNIYYTFDENGVLQDEWFTTATDGNSPASRPMAYTGLDGNKAGWVYAATKRDEDTSKWFYLVNQKNGKMAAFGSGTDSEYQLYAKVINGKTYIFDGRGEMLSGIVTIGETSDGKYYHINTKWNGIKNLPDLSDGTYLFSKAAASQGDDGRMLTGKQAYTDEDETYYYYFRKADEKFDADRDGEKELYSKGSAITDAIKDGSLYGHDGKRVDASDGNSNDLVDIEKWITVDDVKGWTWYAPGCTVIVSSTGKIKKSGNVTIDGTVYKVKDYLVIESYEKGNSDTKNYEWKKGDGTWVTPPTKK